MRRGASARARSNASENANPGREASATARTRARDSATKVCGPCVRAVRCRGLIFARRPDKLRKRTLLIHHQQRPCPLAASVAHRALAAPAAPRRDAALALARRPRAPRGARTRARLTFRPSFGAVPRRGRGGPPRRRRRRRRSTALAVAGSARARAFLPREAFCCGRCAAPSRLARRPRPSRHHPRHPPRSRTPRSRLRHAPPPPTPHRRPLIALALPRGPPRPLRIFQSSSRLRQDAHNRCYDPPARCDPAVGRSNAARAPPRRPRVCHRLFDEARDGDDDEAPGGVGRDRGGRGFASSPRGAKDHSAGGPYPAAARRTSGGDGGGDRGGSRRRREMSSLPSGVGPIASASRGSSRAARGWTRRSIVPRATPRARGVAERAGGACRPDVLPRGV